MILETGTSVVQRARWQAGQKGTGVSGGLVWGAAEGKVGGHVGSGGSGDHEGMCGTAREWALLGASGAVMSSATFSWSSPSSTLIVHNTLHLQSKNGGET